MQADSLPAEPRGKPQLPRKPQESSTGSRARGAGATSGSGNPARRGSGKAITGGPRPTGPAPGEDGLPPTLGPQGMQSAAATAWRNQGASLVADRPSRRGRERGLRHWPGLGNGRSSLGSSAASGGRRGHGSRYTAARRGLDLRSSERTRIGRGAEHQRSPWFDVSGRTTATGNGAGPRRARRARRTRERPQGSIDRTHEADGRMDGEGHRRGAATLGLHHEDAAAAKNPPWRWVAARHCKGPQGLSKRPGS